MLELAVKAYYTHDKTIGFVVVLIVASTMTLIALSIAYHNFGPPAKRRAAGAG